MIVKYSKKFPYAPYLNEDIGFEIEIPSNHEHEAMSTLAYLKEMAEKFHKDNNPQLIGSEIHVNPEYAELLKTEYAKTQASVIIPTIDPRAYETVEIGIDNATTIKDLEFYADIAVKYGLVEMYLAKKGALETK